jgi:Co/Zn/Cd efflux system component
LNFLFGTKDSSCVFHTDNHDQIFQRLDNLKFDTSLIDSVSADNYEATTNNTDKERKLLWQVLAINFFFFALELTTGFISNSMGLVADSLDMLADSIVYGLALFAVGGTMTRKKNIAKSAGYFQLTLASFWFYRSYQTICWNLKQFLHFRQ